MLFTLLDRPVPPGAAVLDTLQNALAIQNVHHRHDGRVRDRAVVPQPLPDLAHHARVLGGPHHVHDGHLKFTELAHLAAPPLIHVSTEDALSGVPNGCGGGKRPPGIGLFAPAAELPPLWDTVPCPAAARGPWELCRRRARREVDLTRPGTVPRPVA